MTMGIYKTIEGIYTFDITKIDTEKKEVKTTSIIVSHEKAIELSKNFNLNICEIPF